MELAFSLLVIIAGVIAFLVRTHQQTPGAITFIIIVCAIYLSPIALAKFICTVASPEVAFTFCMIMIVAISILTIYYIINHDKVDGKLMAKQYERAHEAKSACFLIRYKDLLENAYTQQLNIKLNEALELIEFCTSAPLHITKENFNA